MIFGTKKLKNIGSDLGGAVKGFKDGMKDGSLPPDPSASSANPQNAPAQVQHPGTHTAQSPIDVEVKHKS